MGFRFISCSLPFLTGPDSRSSSGWGSGTLLLEPVRSKVRLLGSAGPDCSWRFSRSPADPSLPIPRRGFATTSARAPLTAFFHNELARGLTLMAAESSRSREERRDWCSPGVPGVPGPSLEPWLAGVAGTSVSSIDGKL